MDHPAPTSNPAFEIDARGIGWITFDDSARKVNVLTEDVMRRLARILETAREAAVQGRVRVVVVRSAKAGTFLAGADLDAIAALEDPGEAERAIRLGQAIFGELERLPVPTVCAIHGTCVGGGVELALACRHRVLSDAPETLIGLPEVQLGILPAWGGTTRLPRLVGLRAALGLLLTGRRVDAGRARRIGFAAEVFPASVFGEKAADFALRATGLPAGPTPPGRGLRDRFLDGTRPGRRLVLAAARRKVRARTGEHYPAPHRILDILGRHLGGPAEDSLDAEAHAASALVVGTVSKNLVHVFRLREAARKGPSGEVGRAEPARVTDLAVLGAGVMGGGIAHLSAARGVRTRLRDVRHEAVSRGLRHARGLFDEAVGRGRLSRLGAAQAMERISGGLDWAGFGAAQMVLEAIVEDLDAKRAALKDVEGRVAPGCIIATNTSSLRVDALAEVLERPERLCAIHFFNPVHRMPLVEIVRGSRTSDETAAAAHAFAVALGKVPVVVRDGPGFVVNRVLAPYLNEAGWLLDEGAGVHEVDRAARDFGMPMGPLRLMDEVGVDVATHAGEVLRAALGERLAPSPALEALGASGRLGRKGGRGFYRYAKGREKGVDPSVYPALGLPTPSRRRGPVDPEEIRRRLLSRMINEAARLLSDGVTRSAAALDLAMVMGTGFPPFRGGLLRFADTLHPRGVLDRTLQLRDRLGPRFTPAPLLEELARDNLTFYEAFGA